MFNPSCLFALLVLLHSAASSSTIFITTPAVPTIVITTPAVPANSTATSDKVDSVHVVNANLTASGSNVSVPSQNGSVHNVARSMNILPQPSHTATTSSSGSNSSSLVMILVLLVLGACILTVIIAALFVMRHRFNTWRLTGGAGAGGKSSPADAENDGTSSNDHLTAAVESGAATGADEASREPASAATAHDIAELTSVDNKQAIVRIESEQDALKKSEEAAATAAAVETPLLGNTTTIEVKEQVSCNETGETAVSVTISMQQVTEQLSSTSLIANVLNELSESVVSKLATSKSPAKGGDDPEKQPLNADH